MLSGFFASFCSGRCCLLLGVVASFGVFVFVTVGVAVVVFVVAVVVVDDKVFTGGCDNALAASCFTSAIPVSGCCCCCCCWNRTIVMADEFQSEVDTSAKETTASAATAAVRRYFVDVMVVVDRFVGVVGELLLLRWLL